MNAKQDFNNIYTDISANISAAMVEISKIDVEHKDGKQELTNILDRLKAIQGRFDGELKTLKEYAEWEKFTIAFFGETNAGKSTIIESLRILFNEESRQKLLQENSGDLEKYEKALLSHINQVRETLNNIYTEYATEVEGIKVSSKKLHGILQSESAARVKRKMWMFACGGCLAGVIAAGVVMSLLGR